MPTSTAVEIEATASKLAAMPSWLEDERGLVGRRTETSLTTIAIAARLHMLLYGSPGTAKSMTIDSVLKHLLDARQFKTQAFKASPPEQFLGPISIKRMADDEFIRIVTNRLADCDFAFIDELSRAPRAVLPAFQGMMVEREFDAGNGIQPVPLMSLFGAVNHLLEDDSELAAFFDRFTLKVMVMPPPSQDQFTQIMRGALNRREQGEAIVPDELLITRSELVDFQRHVETIHTPDSVLDKLGELWANLLGVGISPSIRRYVDLTKAMQAQAAIEGRDEVLEDDLQLAQHSLWTAEAERKAVYGQVVKFASEWVKANAEVLNSFADSVDRLGQIQALVASGSDASTRVTISETERSLRDHAIQLVSEQRLIDSSIERQKQDAQGRDVAELETIQSQIVASRQWISDRLMAGLSI